MKTVYKQKARAVIKDYVKHLRKGKRFSLGEVSIKVSESGIKQRLTHMQLASFLRETKMAIRPPKSGYIRIWTRK